MRAPCTRWSESRAEPAAAPGPKSGYGHNPQGLGDVPIPDSRASIARSRVVELALFMPMIAGSAFAPSTIPTRRERSVAREKDVSARPGRPRSEEPGLRLESFLARSVDALSLKAEISGRGGPAILCLSPGRFPEP
jgi:hypothetical protein